MSELKTVVELRYHESLVRAGIEAALASQPDFVLFTGGDSSSVDIIVADYEAGIAAALEASASAARVPKTLIVTERETEAEVRNALRLGVDGYLLADCRIEHLLDAVREVRSGGRPMSDAAIHRLTESLLHPVLTPREQEVLILLARGYPNKAIASQLNVAVGTVKSFTQRILAKLSAGNRTQAMALAEQRGLLLSLTDHPLEGATERDASAGTEPSALWSADRRRALRTWNGVERPGSLHPDPGAPDAKLE